MLVQPHPCTHRRLTARADRVSISGVGACDQVGRPERSAHNAALIAERSCAGAWPQKIGLFRSTKERLGASRRRSPASSIPWRVDGQPIWEVLVYSGRLRRRTPRPPPELGAPSLINSIPAASSAAMTFVRLSITPRTVPLLASMR
jgi:hypothetical protein